MPTVDLLRHFRMYFLRVLFTTWATLLVAFILAVVGCAEGLHNPNIYVYLLFLAAWVAVPPFAALCAGIRI